MTGPTDATPPDPRPPHPGPLDRSHLVPGSAPAELTPEGVARVLRIAAAEGVSYDVARRRQLAFLAGSPE